MRCRSRCSAAATASARWRCSTRQSVRRACEHPTRRAAARGSSSRRCRIRTPRSATRSRRSPGHATEDFLCYSGFAQLPPDALAALADRSSASTSRRAKSSSGRRPAGADVRDRAGPLPRLQARGRRRTSSGTCARATSSASSSLIRNPRAASVAGGLGLPSAALSRRDDFDRLLDEHPDFRRRLEQRIQQYDFHRLANVPLDFAEEILPAAAAHAAR